MKQNTYLKALMMEKIQMTTIILPQHIKNDATQQKQYNKNHIFNTNELVTSRTNSNRKNTKKTTFKDSVSNTSMSYSLIKNQAVINKTFSPGIYTPSNLVSPIPQQNQYAQNMIASQATANLLCSRTNEKKMSSSGQDTHEIKKKLKIYQKNQIYYQLQKFTCQQLNYKYKCQKKKWQQLKFFQQYK
ncbi:hypothetical protein PPERSA_02855 [Pseudocohnilembus persalinus]|uniref:Uncharacterized protein n=1 Tax=Pseudocohnilembus persalinus TaxID=266149 RepID=A0A0V0QML6_PSEPJ|nr:hypothetical protein PPERSA_02855 [Pseudocohnilembus persalinus]|eukprot:KRX03476.1 hypothetical protein PPERSA_02855 [Pseudocohnilembus persalinus]